MFPLFTASCLAASFIQPVTLNEIHFGPKNEWTAARDAIRGRLLGSLVKEGMSMKEATTILGVATHGGGSLRSWSEDYDSLGVRVLYSEGKVVKVRFAQGSKSNGQK